jgi:hypothetical protein
MAPLFQFNKKMRAVQKNRRLIMQTKKYVQQFYRALVIGCMIYAVTLIADTAAAAQDTTIITIAQR